MAKPPKSKALPFVAMRELLLDNIAMMVHLEQHEVVMVAVRELL